MKIIRSTLLVALGAGVLITFAAVAFLLWFDGQHPRADHVEYYKLYFDVIKTLWAGIGIAMLGMLIPTVIGEMHYVFERLKASRVAYSEAKTGVDYLPLRLSSLPLKEAAALLQQVHVHKHQAELYEELGLHLKRRGFEGTVDEWGDKLFDELVRVRGILEKHASEWDTLHAHVRLGLLRNPDLP